MTRLLMLFMIMTFFACGQKKLEKKSVNSDSTQNLGNDKKTDSKDFEKIGFDLMRTEALDKLKLGLTFNELIRILGEPTVTSKSELWRADGEYHQTFKYTDQGVELDLIGEKETDKQVNSITIVSPCDFKTNKKISIGSNYKGVEQAYKDYIDLESSDSTSLTVGSIYGGLIFSFENGKVKSIFLGASAE